MRAFEQCARRDLPVSYPVEEDFDCDKGIFAEPGKKRVEKNGLEVDCSQSCSLFILSKNLRGTW